MENDTPTSAWEGQGKAKEVPHPCRRVLSRSSELLLGVSTSQMKSISAGSGDPFNLFRH
jgi:hypothetical protein